MEIKAPAVSFGGLFVWFLFGANEAMACVGCGQTSLFSPKILAITMSFILLPNTIVLLIALKIRRDAKSDAAKAAGQELSP